MSDASETFSNFPQVGDTVIYIFGIIFYSQKHTMRFVRNSNSGIFKQLVVLLFDTSFNDERKQQREQMGPKMETTA